jgi:hypothetical protein
MHPASHAKGVKAGRFAAPATGLLNQTYPDLQHNVFGTH